MRLNYGLDYNRFGEGSTITYSSRGRGYFPGQASLILLEQGL